MCDHKKGMKIVNNPAFILNQSGEIANNAGVIVKNFMELHRITVLGNKMAEVSFEQGQKMGQVFNCNGQFAKNGGKKVCQKPKLTLARGGPGFKRSLFRTTKQTRDNLTLPGNIVRQRGNQTASVGSLILAELYRPCWE